jgi:hypothetical protein
VFFYSPRNLLGVIFGESVLFRVVRKILGDDPGDSLFAEELLFKNRPGDAFGDSAFGDAFGDSAFGNAFGDSAFGNAFGDSAFGNAFGDSAFGNAFGDAFGESSLDADSPLDDACILANLSAPICGDKALIIGATS